MLGTEGCGGGERMSVGERLPAAGREAGPGERWLAAAQVVRVVDGGGWGWGASPTREGEAQRDGGGGGLGRGLRAAGGGRRGGCPRRRCGGVVDRRCVGVG